MDILIDNKNLLDYGVECLDWSGALSFAAERENERQWQDKSGVDKNLVNLRYDTKEFTLLCLVKASNEVEAFNLINILVTDMFTRGCFVLSLRDSIQGIRECFICERSNTLVGEIYIRQQNSLYSFKLGLKDINPNAVKYKTAIIGGSSTILYDKGRTAVIYWGNGDRGEVSNSGEYTHDTYTADGIVDIIIDIDSTSDTIEPLLADFEANIVLGEKPQEVVFTDLSVGNVIIWSWDFGDGNTSDEQSPVHTYTTSGVFTVSLQIFNEAQGSDFEQKISYITIEDSRLLINDTGDSLLINDAGDYLLIN